jgi:hypothetical protein
MFHCLTDRSYVRRRKRCFQVSRKLAVAKPGLRRVLTIEISITIFICGIFNVKWNINMSVKDNSEE